MCYKDQHHVVHKGADFPSAPDYLPLAMQPAPTFFESIFPMKTIVFRAFASSALLISVAASAQTQQPQNDILGQLLGAVFGTNEQASEQTLESDWDQGRRPFEQRRAQLETRIDAAVRDGALSRGEADQARREYNDIVRLEAQYAADGSVSQQQRGDLRTRYRALSQRVSGQNPAQTGNQGYNEGRWQPLSTRTADFERRVTAGLRNRTLTQAEATRLRTDWRNLQQVETGYQRGGIDAREQNDLWARYNQIDTRLGGSAGGGFGDDRNSARWTQMGTRLATAERNGSISRNDATQVRAQLSDLARLDVAYANGGYSADERSYLTRRYGEIDAIIGTNRR
ncbi:hypothetical protein [Polymorphobacter sp.]|uniref:hypothetical protein n=1 Tax=Polymorphobacter sp. TaxID=1909290 RepID=UPI003F6EBB30